MAYSVEWNYFPTIEEDFIKTIPFVEPSKDNFDTYSTQYAKILLAAASETDTILKRLCKAIDPMGERGLATSCDNQQSEIRAFPHHAF